MTSNAVQGPQTPVALWVAAAWTRLRCSASSTMTRHRLDRRAWHPGPRRSQRDPRDFYHGLLGLDWVDAELTHDGTPLPRIPPVKGRLGLDFRHKGLSFKPEIIMASDQDDVFRAETRTPGYIVVNLKASYTKPQRHLAHHFSLNVFNVGDRLYRNHLSFIKDLAPEIGRGVRFSYALKFF